MSRASELVANYEAVLARVTSHSAKFNRSPNSVRLLPVSKFKPSSDILALHQKLGLTHFGENYVQELVTKSNELPKQIQWHFLGALQKNKVKDLAKIENLYMIETASDYSKMKKLNDSRDPSFSPIRILLQINTSNEAQKSGLIYSEVDKIIELVRQLKETCSNLIFSGFMTIGSIEESTKTDGTANLDFVRLVELKEVVTGKLGLDNLELSMGMSSDFEEAIRQGSTEVRVGTSIFGARDYAK